VRGEGYEVNEAVTKLLHPADQVDQDLDYEYPKWAGVNDDARTTVELSEVDLQPAGHGLEVLTVDEPRQVGGEIRKLLFPAYQAPVTGLPQGSGVYSLFVSRGVTSLGYDIYDGFTSSPSTTEDIPEMLRDALSALSDVKLVAREEDCDEPSDLATSNAEVVLRKMFDLSPRTYDIYPMGGGEIVIDAGYRGCRIGVFCYPDGRMQYVGLLDDESEEVREDSVENIPTDFLRRVLNQLDP
jgi:hypothetical protein